MSFHKFQPHTCRGPTQSRTGAGGRDETPQGRPSRCGMSIAVSRPRLQPTGTGSGPAGPAPCPAPQCVSHAPPLFELPGGLATRMQDAGTACGQGPSDSGGDGRPPRPAVTQGPVALQEEEETAPPAPASAPLGLNRAAAPCHEAAATCSPLRALSQLLLPKIHGGVCCSHREQLLQAQRALAGLALAP